jgi:hypothetical protein
MPEDTVLVGIVLLAVVPIVAWDAWNSLRGGFDNDFFARPLEEKLPQVAENPSAWLRLGTSWIPITVLLVAGFAAFSVQLAEAGEPVLAALGFGSFLVGALAFVVAIVPATNAVAAAAKAHDERGAVPPWLLPLWAASGVAERTFVVSANLAYVAWGVAMVDSAFPTEWAGWTVFITGLLLAAWASLQDYFFQHMTLIGPIVIGVALIVA